MRDLIGAGAAGINLARSSRQLTVILPNENAPYRRFLPLRDWRSEHVGAGGELENESDCPEVTGITR